MHRTVLTAVLAALCATAFAADAVPVQSSAGDVVTGVRIDLRYEGVYRLTGEELSAAGVALSDLKPGKLSLHCAGQPVPIHVIGGQDGSFDTDDAIEFVGSPPRSELLGDDTVTSGIWFLPENKTNVYFLRWNADSNDSATSAGHRQYTAKPAPAPDGKAGGGQQHFWQWRHWERNYLYSFSTLPPDLSDNFFWMEFRAGMAPDGIIRTYLEFPGFDKSLGLPVELAINTLGKTEASGLSPSHLFSFLYDMKPVGEIRFDGIAVHTSRMTIPPEQVQDEPARISFDSPPDRKTTVDSIALDSIEARYPSRFDAGGSEIYTFNNDLLESKPGQSSSSHQSDMKLKITGLPEGASIFDPGSGAVWQLKHDQRSAVIDNTSALTTYTAVAPYARMKPDHLSVITATDIPAITPDVNALVVYHPRLQQTADTYTSYRRERGWNIEAVSVRAIFDQYNHGFISDAALRDYIRGVADTATSLTHVVLIGDSYFDYREARSFDDPRQLDVLIPIHWVYRPGVTWSGGYQDDNWYGSFENEFRPDVAVGRIPVNTDAEGMEYVRKVIAHETIRAGADDKGLLISSVEKSFQSYVSEIGDAYQDELSTVTYLFPQAETAGKEVTHLQEEINNGIQLMYYVGHGGSMVWRVGPTDFTRQKDLFTPADVAGLTNRNHYPFIVCASCYTTAFDQPKSIGEALVIQPDGGAIAVIGASWKATVQDSHAFNRHLFKYYFDPAVRTMGEASLKAHRDYIPADQERALYSSFTYLGDPCVEIIRQGDGAVSPPPTTSTVYQVDAGHIVFPEYDSQVTTEPAPLVELTPGDFPDAKVYRERVLLVQPPVASKEFLIPDDATSISLTGRSRVAADIFPRIRVNLITADNNRHKVFEGYWQSLAMEEYGWPLSPYVRGKKAHLEVQMLNPGVIDEERTWYFHSGKVY